MMVQSTKSINAIGDERAAVAALEVALVLPSNEAFREDLPFQQRTKYELMI
jgi:hypothetical protein